MKDLASYFACQIEIPKAFQEEFIDFIKSYIDIFHRIPQSVSDIKVEKRYSEDNREFTSYVGFINNSLSYSIKASKSKNDDSLIIYNRSLNYSTDYSNRFIIEKPDCFNTLMGVLKEVHELEQNSFAKSLAFKLDMKMI